MKSVKYRKLFSILTIAFIFAFSFTACQKQPAALSKSTYTGEKKAKYVFLFVGDGMGFPQSMATEAYLKALVGADKSKLVFSKFPARGTTTTYAEDRFITGSAAAATALASGEKTTINTIAKSADRTKNLKTIAELAKEAGWKVGIVSSVSIDHATPAAFYAHEDTRKNYYEISLWLSKSGFDYFAGGGMNGNKSSKRKGRPDALEIAKKKGYKVVKTRDELMSLKAGGKVFAFNHTLDRSQALFYEIDRPKDHISISEFTKKGIELLKNDEGFFYMVEAGKIDWACHQNDAKTAIYDMIAFNEAVEEAYDFYKKHPNETLIVVTGDHECGGMTLGFAGTGYDSFYEKLEYQKMSQDALASRINDMLKEKPDAGIEAYLPLLKEAYGLGLKGLELGEYDMKLLKEALKTAKLGTDYRKKSKDIARIYGAYYYNPLAVTATHILNQKAGIGWTSFSHTAVPVATYAVGVGAELFEGHYDNTDIFKKIKSIADFK